MSLSAPGGGPRLSFQTEAAYVRPTWPAGPGDQQMMMHLDIEVDDLDAAGAHAVAAGAVIAETLNGSTCHSRMCYPVCRTVRWETNRFRPVSAAEAGILDEGGQHLHCAYATFHPPEHRPPLK